MGGGWVGARRLPSRRAAFAVVVVDRDLHARHHISDWEGCRTVDGKPFTIYGSVGWAPIESGLGW